MYRSAAPCHGAALLVVGMAASGLQLGQARQERPAVLVQDQRALADLARLEAASSDFGIDGGAT